MEEHWELFPRIVENQQALIACNLGASEDLETFPATLVLFRTALRKPDSNGMPAEAEFKALDKLEKKLDIFITNAKGLFAGLVTAEGERYFYTYLATSEEELNAFIEKLKKSTGYACTYERREDPERKVYWEELFPSPMEMRMLHDLGVVQALEESGDALTEPRRVDHWAYFDSAEARNAFSEWLKANGYELEEQTEPSEASPQHGVIFFHTCVPDLETINKHTMALEEKAEEFQGEYDGWETILIKDEEAGE